MKHLAAFSLLLLPSIAHAHPGHSSVPDSTAHVIIPLVSVALALGFGLVMYSRRKAGALRRS